MTTIAFVRHGVTDWNAERRIQGIIDVPLNDQGRAQAQALASRFEKEHWDLLFTSQLTRARETGSIIGQALGIPVHTDKRIREVNFGRLEGTNEQDRIKRWGTDWSKLEHGKEKKEQVLKRGNEFLENLVEQHQGRKIIVVSHGTFIRAMLKGLLASDEYNGSLVNTSVSMLHHKEQKWACSLFNCDAHLKQSSH
ncbi:histidine phosphatase family protein [Fictibacillus terranigra]|uniref:Histidine phosphatase family protein n=1 Tax=Fictibacillus terranigra TaxID=3058424 RepID=A0ABT8E450_9BACL|nr:histidine phosphatase family protein [Fictibacillus sp. CENA-BCM004]MDN4072675.1 histidine phosphatase family protein [Fictibacillus sp. CENA-BCM004]